MKAQHAELLTRVPSGQTAVSAAGAARAIAARATRERRDVKAIGVGSTGWVWLNQGELDVLKS